MFRYMRLYLYFLRFSFSKAAQFRVDFFFRIFMDCVFYGVILAFFKILFLHTPTLGHFNQEQVFIFIGGYFFVDAVQMTFFSSNMWMLPTLINRGDLDYYLLRPVSSLFFVTLREFAANSFINLIFAVGIIVWGFQQYQGTLEPIGIVLFFVALLMSCGLFYMMNLLFLMPIFWTHSPKGLADLFWSMTRVMERPDSIYGGWFRRVTTTILPLAIVASYPARILFDENRYEVFALHTLIIFIFALIVRFIWGLALRNYSSASS